jgi:SAM-dependent methyltransferase
MTMEETDPIKELNRLWEPVRPYLARQVSELYGRQDGSVLEVGPFSGLAFELARSGIGASFHLAVFPGAVAEALKAEAREKGLADQVTIAESDDELSGVPAEAFDLVVFRGAFFFPSFFKPDLPAIYRSLKPGGLAFIGGGFGCYTPEEVIRGLELRSKDLNQALGRVRISERDLWSLLEATELKDEAKVVTAGGLWVLLRRGFSAGRDRAFCDPIKGKQGEAKCSRPLPSS